MNVAYLHSLNFPPGAILDLMTSMVVQLSQTEDLMLPGNSGVEIIKSKMGLDGNLKRK